MSKASRSIEDIEVILRKIGVADAASWARSEVEEGIPQLAVILFLKSAVESIDALHDVNGLRDTMHHANGRESVEALGRLLNRGVATSDLLQVVRSALRSYLIDMCFLLDDTSGSRFVGWPLTAELENIHWGLFSINEQGKPGALMPGLHEVVREFVDAKNGLAN